MDKKHRKNLALYGLKEIRLVDPTTLPLCDGNYLSVHKDVEGVLDFMTVRYDVLDNNDKVHNLSFILEEHIFHRLRKRWWSYLYPRPTYHRVVLKSPIETVIGDVLDIRIEITDKTTESILIASLVRELSKNKLEFLQITQ